jgi:hypothetical protein
MSSGQRAVPLPPMWVRWALAVLVAAAIVVGIVIGIHRAGPEGPTSEAGAEAEINRVSDIAIAEDQAPRSAGLPVGVAPAVALERAITSDIRRRIATAKLTGPLQRIGCAASGAGSAGRDPYRCTVRSAGLTYPFLAVIDEHSRRMTWCKVDPPPVAGVGPEIPISASCRA